MKLLLLVDPNESENESELENELPELNDELPEELNELDEGELKASSVKKGFGSGGGSTR